MIEAIAWLGYTIIALVVLVVIAILVGDNFDEQILQKT